MRVSLNKHLVPSRLPQTTSSCSWDVCDIYTLSLIAQKYLTVHGVGEVLWEGLVKVQCWKPPDVVTATADVLDELGLKGETMQLRGWLVCLNR